MSLNYFVSPVEKKLQHPNHKRNYSAGNTNLSWISYCIFLGTNAGQSELVHVRIKWSHGIDFYYYIYGSNGRELVYCGI